MIFYVAGDGCYRRLRGLLEDDGGQVVPSGKAKNCAGTTR